MEPTVFYYVKTVKLFLASAFQHSAPEGCFIYLAFTGQKTLECDLVLVLSLVAKLGKCDILTDSLLYTTWI